MAEPMTLPVDAVVPQLRAALLSRNVLLVAPPGSGKTTRIPSVAAGRVPGSQVILLEPRRLAARLAAGFIASQEGTRLGQGVGLVTRHERQVSDRSRILVMTEGVLVRRITEDPELAGVSCVLLDEFHERSVQVDLCAALLREVQQSLRPDLRVVVMSATVDPEPVRRFFEPCEVLETGGRSHPLRVEHRDLTDPLEPVALARLLRGVVAEPVPEGGPDVLVFLPGTPEIRRTHAALSQPPAEADVVQLYGEMSPQDQARALAPSRRRKILLATNVAESSVTLDGVGTVVDTGWFKSNEFDPARGVDRLQLRRISRYSAEQRAGRAARQGAGVAVRLWSSQRALVEASPAEIHRVDLASVLLTVLDWSGGDPAGFGWYEAPTAGRLQAGLGLLRRLGLVEPEGFRLTDRGARVRSWPIHPRWGVVIERARELGVAAAALDMAAVAEGREVLADRAALRGLHAANDLWERARRMAADGPHLRTAAVAEARRVRRQLGQRTGVGASPPHPPPDVEARLGRALLRGFPDRVGKVGSDAQVTLADGGRAELDPDSAAHGTAFLLALDVGVGPRGGRPRIRSAAPIEPEWLSEETDGVGEETAAEFDPRRERVEGRRRVRYGQLVLADRAAPLDPEVGQQVLKEAAAKALDRALPLTEPVMAFWHRLRLLQAHAPELGFRAPEDLRQSLLPAAVIGCTSFADLRRVDLLSLLEGEQPGVGAAVREHLPDRIGLPSGRRATVAYRPGEPPVLTAPIQELFGMEEAPRLVMGRLVPVVELLGPNRRPIQVTRDLRGFWSRTYPEVRKELRGRYPKHHWPERPTAADAGPLGRRRR
jgi:ATP-dependent helicase HrpB